MREIQRIERILNKLKKLWLEHPNQRLGQLLFNYTRIGTRVEEIGQIKDIFHYEDEDIEEDINLALSKNG